MVSSFGYALYARCRRCLSGVTVEPSYFLFELVRTMLDFAHTNLYLQKACRPNATAEPDLRTPCDDNERGVTLVAFVHTYVHSVKMFALIFCAMVYAAWSDRAGRKRKPFIVLPVLNQLLSAAIGWASACAWTVDPLATAVATTACAVLLGDTVTMNAFAFMYLADVVPAAGRTTRFGVLAALRTAGLMLGKGAAGFVLNALGFRAYYAVCFGVAFVAAVLAWTLVADTSLPSTEGGDRASLWSLWDVRRPLQSCRVILRKGSPRHRFTVVVLFTLFALLVFVHEGQYTVIYLYLRYRFNWNEVMYSMFLFYGCVASIVGSLFSSIILSKVFNIHDALIGTLGSLWDAAVAVSYIFAFKDWQLFLVSGMDIFYGVSTTVCVSLVTKFYDSTEMGHLFAVKQMFCLLIPFCHPIYSYLFKSTLHTMPYAFFFVSFGLYLFGAFLYCVIYALTRNQNLCDDENKKSTD